MPLTSVISPHSVPTTVNRVVASLERRGITVFAVVDHAAGARGVGLELSDEQLVIFGDPRAGTILMQADPTIGYELPLRLLVWESEGETRIGYRPPMAMAEEYAIAGQEEILRRMNDLLEQLVAEGVAAA